jgi:flagellar export protein FliJ
MRRLLRIRDLEEEQSRLALESALSELRRLEIALGATFDQERRGRRLVEKSAQNGELPDRVAGLEGTRSAQRCSASLTHRILDAEAEVAGLREDFLTKRIERRQAETLIREAEAKEAIEEGRRGQRALDDWYRSGLYREEPSRQAHHPAESEALNSEPGAVSGARTSKET